MLPIERLDQFKSRGIVMTRYLHCLKKIDHEIVKPNLINIEKKIVYLLNPGGDLLKTENRIKKYI